MRSDVGRVGPRVVGIGGIVGVGALVGNTVGGGLTGGRVAEYRKDQ